VHIVQSPAWEKLKSNYGTETVRVGDLFYTKHPIPLTGKYFAYCPKVDPFTVDFDPLRKSLENNNCISANFDVPNVLTDSEKAQEAVDLFEQAGCVKSPKDTFTPYNLLLDLERDEDTLLADMHSKHRYNIRYAKKNGVVVRQGSGDADFEIFYDLAIKTSKRQGFYIHPKKYYRLIWDILGEQGIAKTLIAEYEGTPLASWMFFVYDNVLYYPYGGSSSEHLNLHASNLVGWEGILLGKREGCEVFDMWGANADPDDREDPEWGFTNFKKKFGARHVEYIDSYDLVLDPLMYRGFNVANCLRWRVLKAIRKVF
jgi:lipid II:glycine glycyltransferase (peptidoglycan interpeptide bridge formation enzyme)